MLMKRSLYTVGNRFVVIRFGIVVVSRLILSNLAIVITHIIADVDVLVFILTSLRFKFFVRRSFKLILVLVKLIVVVFLGLLKRRILFKLLLDPLFKIGSRHLQQLHQLNLLG